MFSLPTPPQIITFLFPFSNQLSQPYSCILNHLQEKRERWPFCVVRSLQKGEIVFLLAYYVSLPGFSLFQGLELGGHTSIECIKPLDTWQLGTEHGNCMSTAQAPKECSCIWGPGTPWETENNDQIHPKLPQCQVRTLWVFYRGISAQYNMVRLTRRTLLEML